MILVLEAFAEDETSPPAPEADEAPASTEDEDEVVVVEARRDSPRVSEQVLDRERVLQTPGTFEDPVRLVQALPGVAVTPEYSPTAGDLAVRGASPRESRYLLDGIELPYLYHFNGYSSVFHTRLLDELALQPSTFGAQWGDATGAIVETRSVRARPDRVHGSLNLNPIMAGAATEIPIAEAWAVRASARRSFLDLFAGDDEEQYTVFPSFWDYFGRIEHNSGSGAAWSAFGFGAGDHYERYAGEPTLLDPYEKTVNPVFALDKSYHAAGLTHAHVAGSTRVAGTLAWTGYYVKGTLPEAREEEQEHKIQLREELTSVVDPRFTMTGGANATLSHSAIVVVTDRAWGEVEREAPLLGRGVAGGAETWRLRGGAFAEGRFALGPVRFVPGLRVDGDSLTGSVVFDPRANLRWTLAQDTRIRLAAGIYHQFPDDDLLLAPFGDPGLEPARSIQVAGAFETAIAGRLEATVEAYHSWGDNLVETDVGEAPETGVEGRAYGVELGLRYRIRTLFFASATGSWSHSERDGALADYDQPYTLNVLASWTFLPGWNAGLRLRYATGLPYTPIVDGNYEAQDDSYTPVYGETNAGRLPDYAKIDAHLEKRFDVGRTDITLYAEVWYVPEFANTMYLAWRYDYDDVAEVHGPGFVPLLGIRGEI